MNITPDAVDAIELTEILEYVTERLDVLADNDLAALLFHQCSPYNLDDLRTDVNGLIPQAQLNRPGSDGGLVVWFLNPR
jgi:hypothetical protein